MTLLPPPFTADQIRDAMPVGTVLLFTLSGSEGPTHQQWEVVKHAPSTGEFRFSDPDSPLDATQQLFAWSELESHAHFPPGTQRTDVTLKVGRHTLPSWQYTVPSDGDPQIFAFAQSLPGPPVQSPGQVLIADSRLS